MVVEAPRIMIVDDTPANLKLLGDMLSAGGYGVFAFSRGDVFLRAAALRPPDLVLLDIMMPGMDGYEVCRHMQEEEALRGVPVLFLSALGDPVDKIRAFSAGGVDYVTKPFSVEEVQARVATHLRLRFLQRELEAVNHSLEIRVQEQVSEISDAQMATIQALAKLAESRDDDTGWHLERVGFFCRTLAEEAQGDGPFCQAVSGDFVKTLASACALHDIGKVGIEDRILRKPGRLTPEEFEVMKGHALLGAQTLESVERRYPRNPMVAMGIQIARWHHERWNGAGYPDGLSGENIPLAARIMALADVYDALRSERCYKPAMPHDVATELMVRERGKHFDPRLLDLFLCCASRFAEVFDSFPLHEEGKTS